MSWRDAQATARELHAQLRAKHPLGYLRMVLRAWLRILDAEERASKKNQPPESP